MMGEDAKYHLPPIQTCMNTKLFSVWGRWGRCFREKSGYFKNFYNLEPSIESVGTKSSSGQ